MGLPGSTAIPRLVHILRHFMAVLPGDWVEGVALRTGERKKYKINGNLFPLYCFVSIFTLVQHSRRFSSS
jgi:hypothetical protein